MRWRHTNFVDPKLRARFVWMNVMERRHETDNDAVFNRDSKMVPAIAQELVGRSQIDRIIKDTGRNIHKNARIIVAEDFDFDHCRPALRSA